LAVAFLVIISKAAVLINGGFFAIAAGSVIKPDGLRQL
jgi:hypothetical protein